MWTWDITAWLIGSIVGGLIGFLTTLAYKTSRNYE